MKTYFRVLSYAKPLLPFAVPFFTCSILSILFGLANFAMMKPLLDVLFDIIKPEELAKYKQTPVLSTNLESIEHYFYYHIIGIIEDYGKFAGLVFLCITIVTSAIFGNLFKYISLRLSEALKAKTVKKLRMAIFNKLVDLHVGYFTDKMKGDIVSRSTNDVHQVEFSVTNSLTVFLRDPVQTIVYFSILFYMSFELTIFTLITIPVLGGFIGFISKKLKKDSMDVQNSLGRLLGIIDETIVGLKIVNSFGASGYVKEKFLNENDFYERRYKSLSYKRELASPFSEVMGIIIVASILLFGGNLVLSDQSTMSASSFILYILFFVQIINPAKAIVGAISNIQRGIISAERILEIIDTKNEIYDKENAQEIVDFKDQITFNDVRFSYGEKEVLKGINFSLKKGQSVALVGQSGGGKSTIADLIPRFYDIDNGSITIDGTNIKDISIDSLRSQIGIVTQESILFNDSITNNIAFGVQNPDMERVVQAAKTANAHEFITQTENGYDTIIGDRGVKLSGGQRQRISIARAIYKNPPILILDEATSALDTESEKLVQDALNHLMQNRTSLIIAHRLSTIQNVNEILVVEAGEIVERGPHTILLEKTNGFYKKLTEMQAI
ncbi:ABC transporter ATP-binding protein [Flexithrix dorotheae]|uniref:ABC transporter ATP-binding protein n=1 Tax=Flexithrix dorotheae TaxID=70993 RepID=UPI00037E407A|nr:ABC transporter transmembrane domain-containing protein [Flexithrix dorotheae]